MRTIHILVLLSLIGSCSKAQDDSDAVPDKIMTPEHISLNYALA